jgi:hypothetical protein
VSLKLNIKSQGNVVVWASYQHENVKCKIDLVLLDATTTTLDLLVERDPVSLGSIRNKAQHRKESSAILREMQGAPRWSVCISTLEEYNDKLDRNVPPNGTLVLVLRAVLEFFVAERALSTIALVILAPYKNLVSYYRGCSFQALDGHPDIMKTTIEEFLASEVPRDIRLEDYDVMTSKYKEFVVLSGFTGAEFQGEYDEDDKERYDRRRMARGSRLGPVVHRTSNEPKEKRQRIEPTHQTYMGR